MAATEITLTAPAGTWHVLLDAIDVAERHLHAPAWKRHDPKVHALDSCTGCVQELRRRGYQSLRDTIDRLLANATEPTPTLQLPADKTQLLLASLDEAPEVLGQGIGRHCPHGFDPCDDCERDQRKSSAYQRARDVIAAQLR
ncbi:hypothetical protein [Streptosporangium sp. NPDC002721]|uniref:hypothetical protein n=1 Tax=Streptosporangium sp. NPDC002721 TaxID=3366188 RepID=UPI00367C7408